MLYGLFFFLQVPTTPQKVIQPMEGVDCDFSRPNSATFQEYPSLGDNVIVLVENEDPQPQTSIMANSTNELPAIPTTIEVDVQVYQSGSSNEVCAL